MATMIELAALYLDLIEGDTSGERPALLNRDPDPGETNIPVSSNISLQIIDILNDGIDRNATRIYIDGALAFEGGGGPEFQGGWDGPASSVVETADTLSLIIDPTSPFASLATVTVRVVSQTTGGGAFLDTTYSFIIEDKTAPSLLLARAIDSMVIRVLFNDSMRAEGDGDVSDTISTSNYSIEALTAPAVDLNIVSIERVSPILFDITVDIEVSPGATYQVTVANTVEDDDGNKISPSARTASFLGFVPWAPPDRDFSLWDMVGSDNRRRDTTGDLRKFIDCLQDVLYVILGELDKFWDIYDPDFAPEPFVDAMLADLGNPFPWELSEIDKRRLANNLLSMYKGKGTEAGIIDAARFFIGVEITLVDCWNCTAFQLDVSELDDPLVGLAPETSRQLYSFDAYVDTELSIEQRKRLIYIIKYMKPAHTHLVNVIEPTGINPIDEWILDVCSLDVNAILGE